MSSESFKMYLKDLVSDGGYVRHEESIKVYTNASISEMMSAQELRRSLQKSEGKKSLLSMQKAILDKEVVPEWITKRTELMHNWEKSAPKLMNPMDATVEELNNLKKLSVEHTAKLKDIESVPPQLEMDIPAVCIKGVQEAVSSPLGFTGA